MTDRDDEERRLASGWGARSPRQAGDRARQDEREDRVAHPEGVGQGDQPEDEREEEANLAQGDPLSGNPPA
jgi:hypothetical protein